MRIFSNFQHIILCLIAMLCILAPDFASAQESAPHPDIDAVLLGDSNLWTGGDNCDKPASWSYWWKETFAPASCRSYARSGATWTNTAATRRNLSEDIAVLGRDNVIYNQVGRLIEAADSGIQPEPQLIMIAAGTNDAWFKSKRPGIFRVSAMEVNPATVTHLRPAQATSLAQSVMLACGELRRRFPKARIVLLTPPPNAMATPSSQARVADIIAESAKMMKLPVIRLDRDSAFDPKREKSSPHLTTDGVHTSIDGARHVAEIVLRQLSELEF